MRCLTCSRERLPKRIALDVSSYCNLSCGYCPRHCYEHVDEHMPIEMIKDIMSQLNGPVTVIWGWRGEPLMHPQFEELWKYSRPRDTNILITNGILVPERLNTGILLHIWDVISVSIHSPESWKGFEHLYRLRERLELKKPKLCVTRLPFEPEFPVSDCMPDEIRVYEEHTIECKWGHVEGNNMGYRECCSRLETDLCISSEGYTSRCCYVWKCMPLSVNDMNVEEIWASPDLVYCSTHYPDPICEECDQWEGHGRSLSR